MPIVHFPVWTQCNFDWRIEAVVHNSHLCDYYLARRDDAGWIRCNEMGQPDPAAKPLRRSSCRLGSVEAGAAINDLTSQAHALVDECVDCGDDDLAQAVAFVKREGEWAEINYQSQKVERVA